MYELIQFYYSSSEIKTTYLIPMKYVCAMHVFAQLFEIKIKQNECTAAHKT